MGNNNIKGDIVELWGQKFKIVKKGLDETEVASFISKLIDERDRLVEQEKHLASLSQLAEKTIIESDKLAEKITEEAKDKAKAEAATIIAKAEEQAEQMIKEIRAEIITVATEEAETIKADAEREAKLLLENQRQKIQPELKDMAQRVYNELLSQLERLKQQTIALKVEFEQKLPQFVEEIRQEPVSGQVPTARQQESDLVPAIDSKEDIEEVEVSAEAQQPTQETEQTDTSKLEEKIPVSVDSQETTIYDGEVALEILPPIDINRMMGIIRHLDSLAEVENTELIPRTDKPLIIVFLRKPMHLTKTLRTLPEVDEVKEATIGEITNVTDAGGTEDNRRKIQIALSGNSE